MGSYVRAGGLDGQIGSLWGSGGRLVCCRSRDFGRRGADFLGGDVEISFV